MSRNNVPTILLGTLLLLGFGLRFYQLDRQPLRGDEAFTVQYWMMVPVSETIQQQLTVDPQPLFAYASFNAWGQLLGIGPFVTRALPALFGVLSIAAIYAFSHRLTGSKVIALIATLMWVLHPFAIWHSQDIRNYAPWSAMSLIAMWLSLCALNRGRRADWIAFVSAAMLAGYLYYLDLFMLVALSLGVAVAYAGNWRIYLHWVFAMAVIGLLLAPWYLQPELLSGGGYGGTATGFKLSKLFVTFPRVLFFGFTALPHLPVLQAILLLSLLVIGVIITFYQDSRQGWLLALLGFVPLILLSLVTLRLNVLAPRYVLAVAPIYTLIVASLIVYLLQQGYFIRIVGIVLLLVWLGFSSLSLNTYYTDYTKSPAWPTLTAYLADHNTDNDLVIQAAADAAFGYYYHHVDDIAADERALPATPEQPADEIHRELTEASSNYDAIWLVAQGFTDWPNYGVVETWLDEKMQRVIDTNADGLRVQQYRSWDVDLTINTPLTQFGDVVELVDITVFDQPQPTGERLVWLYWHPLRQTETRLKAFVHLVGPVNPATGTLLWSQDDHDPQLGRATTTDWQPGTIYRDVFTLPNAANLPTGDYQLVTGFYDPETSQRLSVTDETNTYLLATFTVP